MSTPARSATAAASTVLAVVCLGLSADVHRASAAPADQEPPPGSIQYTSTARDFTRCTGSTGPQVVLTSDVTVIAEPGGAAQMIVNGETLTGTWKGSDDASGNVILALTAPNGDKANGGIVQGGKDSTFVMSFGGRCANSIGPMTRSTVAAPTTAAATLAPGTAPTPAAGGAVAPASANTGSSSTGLLVGGGAAVIVLAGAGTFVVLRRRERTAAEVASSRPGKS